MFNDYGVEKSKYGYVISQEVLEACLQQNKVDFKDCYFENVVFDGEKIQVAGLQFENSRFLDCRFTNVNLNGSCFSGATLSGCTFKGVVMENADLKKSYINTTSFIDTIVNKVDFSFATLHYTSFGTGTVLQNLNLLQTKFSNTVFHPGFQFNKMKGLQYVSSMDFHSSGTTEEVNRYSNSIKSILAKGMVELNGPDEPIVHIMQSELSELKDIYLPLHEADALLARHDAQIHEDSKQADYDGPYYCKTTYEILYTQNNEEKQFIHRLDIGDGYGGLIDNLQREYEYFLNTEDGQKHFALLMGDDLEREKEIMQKELNEFVPYLRGHVNSENSQELNMNTRDAVRRKRNSR